MVLYRSDTNHFFMGGQKAGSLLKGLIVLYATFLSLKRSGDYHSLNLGGIMRNIQLEERLGSDFPDK